MVVSHDRIERYSVSMASRAVKEVRHAITPKHVPTLTPKVFSNTMPARKYGTALPVKMGVPTKKKGKRG